MSLLIREKKVVAACVVAEKGNEWLEDGIGPFNLLLLQTLAVEDCQSGPADKFQLLLWIQSI